MILTFHQFTEEYDIDKKDCERSDGRKGSWIMSYKTKKGKKVKNCHFTKKNAQAQIRAIEAPPR